MLDTNYKEKDGKPSWFYRFDNVGDYFRECVKETDMPMGQRSSYNNDFTFTRSHSMEETLNRYRQGFPEGTQKARSLMLKITPFLRTIKGIKRGWRPRPYAGGNFIVDNYAKGIPELCNVMSPVVSKNFASLILNGTASCAVSTEVMLRRGVAMIALAQILESNGYRVSIKIAYAERGYKGERQYTLINLKPFNQSIELDRLAFFLADPSAFRRLNFSFMETRPASIRELMGVPGNYGTPSELPSSEITPNDIYLGCAHSGNEAWRTDEGCIEYIKTALKKYGIDYHA